MEPPRKFVGILLSRTRLVMEKNIAKRPTILAGAHVPHVASVPGFLYRKHAVFRAFGRDSLNKSHLRRHFGKRLGHESLGSQCRSEVYLSFTKARDKNWLAERAHVPVLRAFKRSINW